MNEFIVSTKGSLWECSCPKCQQKGERQGSRKGAPINTLSRDERQQLYNMIDAKLKSEGKPWDYVYTVTGKDYEGTAYEAFANMPENKDMVNGLILEITNSRQGSRKGLKYNWDGVPFEEIEFRLDSPVIDEDIYSMSDEELLQFAEDHGLRPEMFTNELPDWAQRDGSRKGSRKGGNMTGAEWILNNKYIYENGEIKLGLIQLKDIPDATDKFKQQIISEGKEDYYIVAIAAFGGTFSMQLLPIYGDPNKYVTKWFCPTPQGAIDSAKRDRGSVASQLLKGQVDENGNVTSRQGSRKGSRKGRTLMSANGWFDVSDIDKLIAEGNIPNKGEWGLQGYIEDYLKSKRYSSKEANLTWDAWARFEDLRYGIPEGKYDEVINRHRKIVGLPPL